MRPSITLGALLFVTGTLFAADAPASPIEPEPTASGPMVAPGLSRTIIGPAESKTVPGDVHGTLAAFVNPPRGLSPETVEVFAGDRSVGTVSSRPYVLEFDTTTVPDGQLVLKAVAKGADGKQIWTGTVTLTVRNADQTLPDQPGPPAKPAVAKPDPAVSVTKPSPTLTYASEKYGFTVRYPAGWTVKDETAHMRPKMPGGFWLVFGSEPIDKSEIVVNVRHRKLEPTTDADIFAKYNTYVQKWKRTTVLGSPAFVTTAGSRESKRVIHRKIIIKDGSAWMFNCIDTTGNPESESEKLFDSIVNTLKSFKQGLRTKPERPRTIQYL